MKKKCFNNVFFIGIGGSGMSSLAHILLDRNCNVSGYDKNPNDSVQSLVDRGVEITGNTEINLQNYDIAVYSTAIRKEHPLYSRFKQAGIRMMHRSELMHEIFSDIESVAVAGSHGKTSTTGMVAQIMVETGQEPTVMIGGQSPVTGGRGGISGKSNLGVYEADESDGSFLNNDPGIRIITNIDNDHLDYYENQGNLYKAFALFAGKTGKTVMCYDDAGVREIIPMLENTDNIILYGRREAPAGMNYVKLDFDGPVRFILMGDRKYEISLPLPGEHYLYNAAAAVIASELSGIEPEKSLAVLKGYKGVKRRLEKLGRFGNTDIFDDYGHHPTELQTVIESLSSEYQKLGIVFQPHRFTRTRQLADEFARVLSGRWLVFLLPVYSAGEDEISGINSELILSKINNSKTGLLSGDIKKDIELLKKSIGEADALLCIGAGNVREWGESLLS